MATNTVWIAALMACCESLLGQAKSEPVAIIELGGATGWSVRDRVSSFGPDVAVEVEPIENWLELEAGFTPLIRHGSTEWGTDLLFKKPWTLSKKVEFMAGAGPEWILTRDSGITANSVAVEAVLDFMFWPSTKHKFGWFIEPGYEYSFARGHERAIGVSGGLLIGIFQRTHRRSETVH